MSRKVLLLLAAALMVNGRICFAQVEQGAITGAVVDPSGASVPKAKVTATNQATGTVAATETTDDGYYKIPYLPAGKYKLSVEKEGFSINRVTEVPVQVGQSATINVTLKPGSVHDEVTVTSNAVLIDQVSSSLGYVAGAVQVSRIADQPEPLLFGDSFAWSDQYRQHRDGIYRQRRPVQYYLHSARRTGHPEQFDP